MEAVGPAGNVPWHVCDKTYFSTALEEALVGILLKAKFMGAATAFGMYGSTQKSEETCLATKRQTGGIIHKFGADSRWLGF